MTKISLVIPTRNKLPRLRLTLASLCRQTISPDDFEVVVVDDGSTDGTQDYLRRLASPFALRLIHQSHMGRAAARNAGLRTITSRFTIFIDDDVLLAPQFIQQHIEQQTDFPCISRGRIYDLPFLKFFADPSTGELFDPRTQRKPSALLENCIQVTDLDLTNSKITPRARITKHETLVEKSLMEHPALCDWIAFAGGNVCIPSKLLHDFGGFDEGFATVWGCEDLELGYRLWKAKQPFVYQYNAVNYHMTHIRRNFAEDHLRSTLYFYSKHKDPNILLFHEYATGNLTLDQFFRDINEKGGKDIL